MPKEVEVRSLSSIVAAIGTSTPTYLPREINSHFSQLFLILLYLHHTLHCSLKLILPKPTVLPSRRECQPYPQSAAWKHVLSLDLLSRKHSIESHHTDGSSICWLKRSRVKSEPVQSSALWHTTIPPTKNILTLTIRTNTKVCCCYALSKNVQCEKVKRTSRPSNGSRFTNEIAIFQLRRKAAKLQPVPNLVSTKVTGGGF